MTNAQLLRNNGNEAIVLNAREVFETDEDGLITINKTVLQPIFIYDAVTGVKITDWTITGNIISLNQQYKNVIVDYSYEYDNGYTTLSVGNSLTAGYFSLIGKMRVKDDVTGKVTTGILKIPKLRLMSDLSIRLGSDAIPQVGRLDALAVPGGARGQTKVMEIIFLDDDIDADM